MIKVLVPAQEFSCFNWWFTASVLGSSVYSWLPEWSRSWWCACWGIPNRTCQEGWSVHHNQGYLNCKALLSVFWKSPLQNCARWQLMFLFFHSTEIYVCVSLNRAFWFPSGVGTTSSALGDDGVLDIDTTISLETTWHAMEELVSMGLVRSIGIRWIEMTFFFSYLVVMIIYFCKLRGTYNFAVSSCSCSFVYIGIM